MGPFTGTRFVFWQDLVELPRLKLAFTARPDHEGTLRLYSVDHVDLFLTNEGSDTTKKMLLGIPHSLLLSNVRGETQVRPSLFHSYLICNASVLI